MASTKPKNDLILFTGAGFTKNFGGFLGKEMWAKIFNYPHHPFSKESATKVNDLLLENHNFENAYSEIFESKDYDQTHKNCMGKAVDRAYELLDISISQVPSEVSKTFERDFLSWLFPEDKINFWFTLNQDLLAEREFGLNAIGIDNFKYVSDLKNQALPMNRYKTLPKNIDDSLIENEILSNKKVNYIKLHGSYGWRFSFADYQNAMVIGLNKESIIEKESLLKAYFDLLKQILSERNKKILFIGYGFRDKHINDLIIEGVRNGLELYIINPMHITDFAAYLRGGSCYFYEACWKSIKGYFPYEMNDICSPDSTLLTEILHKLTLYDNI